MRSEPFLFRFLCLHKIDYSNENEEKKFTRHLILEDNAKKKEILKLTLRSTESL